jgi:biotin carboxylase
VEKVAVVLGGTIAHKYLIENLKGRGFYTVLVDYLENPPASQSCDIHIRASTLDQDVVLEIAKEYNASLVISGCVDQANLTACFVSEKLGIFFPYSHETALRVTDKSLMKEGMRRASIPTASYEILDANDRNNLPTFKFPRVVKPCDCNGSKGVRKVFNQDEFQIAFERALTLSRSGKVIVENFNPGIEINAYFLVGDEDVFELYLKRKGLPLSDFDNSLMSYCSVGPVDLSVELRNKISDIAVRIAKEFKLKNIPLLLQANVDGDELSVIEFAPRVGGGLAFREILHLTGFDLISAIIRSCLNERILPPSSLELSQQMSVIHLYCIAGTVAKVEGVGELYAQGIVEEYFQYIEIGGNVDSTDLASRNRVAGVIIKSQNLSELYEKVHKLRNTLKFLDGSERNLLRIDLLDRLE